MSKNKELTDDLVQPFQLESGAFRGRLVRLGPALDLVLHQHAYPDIIGSLLGEAMVIASALATALKYEGVFTFQAKGEGPVKLLVADVMSGGGIRGYAQFDKDQLDGKKKNTKLFGSQAYLAFTIDQKKQDDRYQGIVELTGGTLAEAVQHYFRQSEQLLTGIMAAIRRDSHGRWHGGCLMLQQMPREGGVGYASDTSSEDDWQRIMMLMATCTAEELTDPMLDPNDLLFRLFHEEGVRVFEPHGFRHECRCSAERVEGMLISLPRSELEDLAVNGVINVTCEFCNKTYTYDEKQRQDLYTRSE